MYGGKREGEAKSKLMVVVLTIKEMRYLVIGIFDDLMASLSDFY